MTNNKFFSLTTGKGDVLEDLTAYIAVAQEYAVDEKTGVSNFKTLNAQIAKMLEADGISKCVFHSGDNVQAVNGYANCKSALTAGTSHLFYNTYGSPLTTEGLHIRKAVEPSCAEAYNAGYVSNRYQGKLVDAPEKGWLMVGREYFAWTTNPIKADAVDNTMRKHKYIDYMLMGVSLEVWIAPIRDYMATFLMQWFATSEANGFLIREERMDAFFERKEVRKVQVANYHASQDPEVELPSPAPTAEGEVKLLFQFIGKVKKVDLMKLQPQSFMLYSVRRGRKVALDTVAWDPNDAQSVADFTMMAADVRYAVDNL